MLMLGDTMNCGYCGMLHPGQVCPRVKAIEYHPDGVTVKRVEFHPPVPLGGWHGTNAPIQGGIGQ